MNVHPQPTKRVFKVGALQLVDPTPMLPKERAWKAFAPNYPHLKNAVLSDGKVVGETLVIEVEVPPVKING